MAEAVDGALALTTTSAAWSPTVTATGGAGSFAVTANCRAVKTGKEVMLEGSINILASAPVGNLAISNLPYVPDAQIAYTCGVVAAYTGITLPTGFTQLGIISTGSSTLTLISSGSGQTATVLDLATAFGVGSAVIHFQYRYQTT